MKSYYYFDGQDQFGPISKEELKAKGITKESLVWFEGLTEWQKAGEVEELAELFSNSPAPPPLQKQKSVVPPPISEQRCKRETHFMEPMQNNKSKNKTIIMWCSIVAAIVILVVAGIVGYNMYEQNQYEQQRADEAYNERIHPENYLSMGELNINNNILSGLVRNDSKRTTYKQIKFEFCYYGQNGEVLQTDVYTVNGVFYPQSSTPFHVKIRNPQGLKNLIKWEKWSVNIVSAVPKNL